MAPSRPLASAHAPLAAWWLSARRRRASLRSTMTDVHARVGFAKHALAGLLIASGARACTQVPAPADRSADARAIRAHIESIFQAFVDKDRAKLRATHGADWRGFTPWSGAVIRGLDGYMSAATFAPGTPKGQGMVGYRLSDFDVVFYGDTAVATFVADLDVVSGSSVSGGSADRTTLALLD